MKRRKFILSLIGSASVVGWAGWQAGSFNRRNPKGLLAGELAKVKRSTWALGTGVNLTVYHQDAALAGRAIDRAFSALEQVEEVMSLYRPKSQICELNRTGFLGEGHPYLKEVLETAAWMSRRTNGAFDITVQPLYQLYAEAAAKGQQPTAEDMRKTLERVDWRKVVVDGRSVRLEGMGTEITLNGIAQGFAADIVSQVLRDHGIEHALVDTGEIGTVGMPAGKDAWTIGIKHPRQADAFLCLASLKGRSLATSGDYETRFGEGFDNNHLLDPSTGHSPLELSSVSVVAPTGLLADALSTALFLTGPKNGMELVQSIPGADALFVTKDGRLMQTDGFPIRT